MAFSQFNQHEDVNSILFFFDSIPSKAIKQNKINLFLIGFQALTTFFHFYVFSEISQDLIDECLKSA